MFSLFFPTILLVIACNGDLSMPLREAAEGKGIFVGAGLDMGNIQSDSTYHWVAHTQYNLMTAGNACKWWETEPQENVYKFENCDFMYNYAKQYNMTFRGHNLCWGEDNPSWLTNGNYNSQQLQQFLESHISTVVKHYPNNQFYCWDVVNEAVADNGMDR